MSTPSTESPILDEPSMPVDPGPAAPVETPSPSAPESSPTPVIAPERLQAVADLLSQMYRELSDTRKRLFEALTPTSASSITALASDAAGLAGATVFSCPVVALAPAATGKLFVGSDSEGALSSALGTQYKLSTLSPTALAERLSQEPAVLARIRDLSPSLDALRTHPLVGAATAAAEAQGTTDEVNFDAEGLRAFLHGE